MRWIVLGLLVLVTLVSVLEAKKGKLKKAKDCKRPCPRDYRPVCATNGVTYTNNCEFRNAVCVANKKGVKLLKRSNGQCGKPGKGKPKNKKNVPGKSKKRRAKKCAENTSHCKTLNSTRNAVCGSNNITYHTYCHFKVAKCKADQAGQIQLSLQYKGVCGKPKKPVVCPQASQCHNRNGPICGGDGLTYRNLCHFLVAKCNARKLRTKLRFMYRGACGSPTKPKPCPRKCSKKGKTVCGTDGKTYRNGCELATAKCRLPKGQKRQLTVRHRGPCGAPTTAKPCLTEHKCRRKRSPVCGTDGVTYRSKCHFRMRACQAKRNKRSTISLKHTGPCSKDENGIGL